jgi:hypothetical protein
MKRLLFAICLFSSIIAKAQFEKGEKYIGGSTLLSFQSQSITQNTPNNNISGKGFAISLNPQFLKASNSSTLKGVYTGLQFSAQKTDQDIVNYANTTLGAGVGYLIRKYKPLSEKIFWYMQYDAELGYTYQWLKFSNGTSDQNSWYGQLFVEAFPALAFKADDRLLVDVNFGGLITGYQYSKSETSHNNNYFVQLSFTSRISLGILWKIKKSSGS